MFKPGALGVPTFSHFGKGCGNMDVINVSGRKIDQKTTRKYRGGVCKYQFQRIRNSKGAKRQQENLPEGWRA